MNNDLPPSCKFQNMVTINSEFTLLGLMVTHVEFFLSFVSCFFNLFPVYEAEEDDFEYGGNILRMAMRGPSTSLAKRKALAIIRIVDVPFQAFTSLW